MTAEIVFAPLVERDIAELSLLLRHEAVYAHLGGVPSEGEFTLWLQRALAGPPADAHDEVWINTVVRLADTGEAIGRLEANVHDELAEVAFEFAPRFWGRGHASTALLWLHGHLRRHGHVERLWACTHPDNRRSAALLTRCGYSAASTRGLPRLFSYDEGDAVFSRSMGEPDPQATRCHDPLDP